MAPEADYCPRRNAAAWQRPPPCRPPPPRRMPCRTPTAGPDAIAVMGDAAAKLARPAGAGAVAGPGGHMMRGRLKKGRKCAVCGVQEMELCGIANGERRKPVTAGGI